MDALDQKLAVEPPTHAQLTDWIARVRADADLHDGAASRRGIVLAMVRGTCRIHGVSG